MPQADFYSDDQRQQMEALENLIENNYQRLEVQGRYLDPAATSLRSDVAALHEEFQTSGNVVDNYYAMTNDPLSQPRDQMQAAAFYVNMQAAEQAHARATNAWLGEGLRVERGVHNALNTHEEFGMDRIQTMVVVTPSHLGQGDSSSRSRSSNQGQASSSKASSSKASSSKGRGR